MKTIKKIKLGVLIGVLISTNLLSQTTVDNRLRMEYERWKWNKLYDYHKKFIFFFNIYGIGYDTYKNFEFIHENKDLYLSTLKEYLPERSYEYMKYNVLFSEFNKIYGKYKYDNCTNYLFTNFILNIYAHENIAISSYSLDQMFLYFYYNFLINNNNYKEIVDNVVKKIKSNKNDLFKLRDDIIHNRNGKVKISREKFENKRKFIMENMCLDTIISMNLVEYNLEGVDGFEIGDIYCFDVNYGIDSLWNKVNLNPDYDKSFFVVLDKYKVSDNIQVLLIQRTPFRWFDYEPPLSSSLGVFDAMIIKNIDNNKYLAQFITSTEDPGDPSYFPFKGFISKSITKYNDIISAYLDKDEDNMKLYLIDIYKVTFNDVNSSKSPKNISKKSKSDKKKSDNSLKLVKLPIKN